jgi:hypothetical protein
MAALGCQTSSKGAKKQSPATSKEGSSSKKSLGKNLTEEIDDGFCQHNNKALILYDSTDDESYQDAKRKAESCDIDLPPGKNGVADDAKNKKRRASLGEERRDSLNDTIKEQNGIIAESNKHKVNIENRRLALEEERAKKEDRRFEMEQARVMEDIRDRQANREFMLSMITMMNKMSENLMKFSGSNK